MTEQIDRDRRVEASKHSFPKELVAAIEEQPRLVRALSLFVQPIHIEFIEAAGFSFSTWTNSIVVTILTDVGPYLRSIARLYVLDHATPEEMLLARQDCINILDQSVALWGDSIGMRSRYHRAENCASAGHRSQAITDVAWLCEYLKIQDNPAELVMLLLKTKLNASELPDEARKIALWAYEKTNWRPPQR